MAVTISKQIVLNAGEGLRLQSGPGRDLIFKVTGEDTNGALDYFIVEVAPHGGPTLHVHHFKKKPSMCLKVASRSALATRSITSTRAALLIYPPKFHMPSST